LRAWASTLVQLLATSFTAPLVRIALTVGHDGYVIHKLSRHRIAAKFTGSIDRKNFFHTLDVE
jgi:hypothetical protein